MKKKGILLFRPISACTDRWKKLKRNSSEFARPILLNPRFQFTHSFATQLNYQLHILLFCAPHQNIHTFASNFASCLAANSSSSFNVQSSLAYTSSHSSPT